MDVVSHCHLKGIAASSVGVIGVDEHVISATDEIERRSCDDLSVCPLSDLKEIESVVSVDRRQPRALSISEAAPIDCNDAAGKGDVGHNLLD